MAALMIEPKSVSICETLPLLVRGLKSLLDETGDLRLHSVHLSVAEWMMSPIAERTQVLIVDKALDADLVLDSLARLPLDRPRPGVVVWSQTLQESEALRFLQKGARGILRKSVDLASLLTCLRAVGQGATWMQDSVFPETLGVGGRPASELTPREQQVLELVEQGFKNREIAGELGIRPGTVKIHLKHIFEKTGIHGRHGLALTVLRQKGLIPHIAS
jgi:two-component system, NarL family, nitrate/nitrite response regulator NarL